LPQQGENGLVRQLDLEDSLLPVFSRVAGSVEYPTERRLNPRHAVEVEALAERPEAHGLLNDLWTKGLVNEQALGIVLASDEAFLWSIDGHGLPREGQTRPKKDTS
jgi:hypothetical protein